MIKFVISEKIIHKILKIFKSYIVYIKNFDRCTNNRESRQFIL